MVLYWSCIWVVLELYSSCSQVVLKLWLRGIEVIFEWHWSKNQVVFKLHSISIEVVFEWYLSGIEVVFKWYLSDILLTFKLYYLGVGMVFKLYSKWYFWSTLRFSPGLKYVDWNDLGSEKGAMVWKQKNGEKYVQSLITLKILDVRLLCRKKNSDSSQIGKSYKPSQNIRVSTLESWPQPSFLIPGHCEFHLIKDR